MPNRWMRGAFKLFIIALWIFLAVAFVQAASFQFQALEWAEALS